MLLISQAKKKLTESLIDLAKNGLRTLVIASAEKEASWWEGEPAQIWQECSKLPDADTEQGHLKGKLLLLQLEWSGNLTIAS